MNNAAERPAPRILIIGAGPAGLATAAALRQLNLPFRLLDRYGVSGGAYARIHSGMEMASPARYGGLGGMPFDPGHEYGTVRDCLEYLQEFAIRNTLIPEPADVLLIEPDGREFLVRHRQRAELSARFDVVVVASGVFDYRKPVAIPGLPTNSTASSSNPLVLHGGDWPGAEKFRGQRLLIIGAGMSGVEIAEEGAQASLAVTISARRGSPRLMAQRLFGRDIHDYVYYFERLPPWLWRNFCSHRPALRAIDRSFRREVIAGRIVLKPEVFRFDGQRAHFSDGTQGDADVVVMATGYHFAAPFLPADELRAPAGHPQARDGESQKYPGLYYVGSPCARALDSEFLRGIARDAVVVAGKIKQRLAG